MSIDRHCIQYGLGSDVLYASSADQSPYHLAVVERQAVNRVVSADRMYADVPIQMPRRLWLMDKQKNGCRYGRSRYRTNHRLMLFLVGARGFEPPTP